MFVMLLMLAIGAEPNAKALEIKEAPTQEKAETEADQPSRDDFFAYFERADAERLSMIEVLQSNIDILQVRFNGSEPRLKASRKSDLLAAEATLKAYLKTDATALIRAKKNRSMGTFYAGDAKTRDSLFNVIGVLDEGHVLVRITADDARLQWVVLCCSTKQATEDSMIGIGIKDRLIPLRPHPVWFRAARNGAEDRRVAAIMRSNRIAMDGVHIPVFTLVSRKELEPQRLAYDEAKAKKTPSPALP